MLSESQLHCMYIVRQVVLHTSDNLDAMREPCWITFSSYCAVFIVVMDFDHISAWLAIRCILCTIIVFLTSQHREVPGRSCFSLASHFRFFAAAAQEQA